MNRRTQQLGRQAWSGATAGYVGPDSAGSIVWPKNWSNDYGSSHHGDSESHHRGSSRGGGSSCSGGSSCGGGS